MQAAPYRRTGFWQAEEERWLFRGEEETLQREAGRVRQAGGPAKHTVAGVLRRPGPWLSTQLQLEYEGPCAKLMQA